MRTSAEPQPTVSLVPNESSRATPAREVGARFEALLLGAALKPLATALGFYGDLVVASASTAMFRGERDGLTERLSAMVDADRGAR